MLLRLLGLAGCVLVGAVYPMVLPAGAGAPTGARLLGANLLPNSGFEQWPDARAPEGWKLSASGGECAADAGVFAEGARSVRFHIPKGPAWVTLTTEPVRLSAPWYYARFAFRVEGLTKTTSYGGGQADMRLLWEDTGGKLLRTDYVEWSYFPLEWAYRDRFYQPPEGAAQVRALVSLSGAEQMQLDSTAWFDDVALCPYQPPVGVGEKVKREWSVTAGREVPSVVGAPAWFYLAGAEGAESAQAQRVRDPDALLGAALHARRGAAAGMVFHTAYTLEQPPGLYRVFFRVKAPAAPLAKRDASIAELDVISSDSGTRGSRALRWTELRQPARYEDVWFDFTKRTRGWIAVRVATPGGDAELSLDHVRVVELQRFSDPDLLAWYPGIAGMLGANPSLARPGKGFRALVVNGLLADRFRLDEALHGIPDCQVTALPYGFGQGGGQIPDFPLLWRDLRQYSLVVFANASLGALGPEQRYQLRESVRLGGGLLLLGGKAAYGGGDVAGSFLEEVLPVAVSRSSFDIVPGGAISQQADGPAFGRLPAGLAASFVHDTRLRPGARQVLAMGGKPALAVMEVGKGRVACLAAAPYGQPGGGLRFFADAEEWPGFLRGLMGWLAAGR